MAVNRPDGRRFQNRTRMRVLSTTTVLMRASVRCPAVPMRSILRKIGRPIIFSVTAEVPYRVTTNTNDVNVQDIATACVHGELVALWHLLNEENRVQKFSKCILRCRPARGARRPLSGINHGLTQHAHAPPVWNKLPWPTGGVRSRRSRPVISTLRHFRDFFTDRKPVSWLCLLNGLRIIGPCSHN